MSIHRDKGTPRVGKRRKNWRHRKESQTVIFHEKMLVRFGLRKAKPELRLTAAEVRRLIKAMTDYSEARRFVVKASVTNPETRGANTLAEQPWDRFFGFISTVDYVEPQEDADVPHYLIQLQAIHADFVQELWNAMTAGTQEARFFQEFVTTTPDWADNYGKLPADLRLALYQVHAHFLLWTLDKDNPSRHAQITLRLNRDSPGVDGLLSHYWIAVELGGTQALQADGALSADDVCIYQESAIDAENNGEIVERQIRVGLLPPEMEEVLKGLYFGHYYLEVDSASPGSDVILPPPFPIDPSIFQERKPPQIIFPSPDGQPFSPDNRRREELPDDDDDAMAVVDGASGWGGGGGRDDRGDEDGDDNGDDDDEGDDDEEGDDDDGAPPPVPPPANPMLYHPGTSQPFVGVHSIGSGNCVGLYDRNGLAIAYTDFGYPLPPNVGTFPGLPLPCVCNDPVMLISHWDYDHYAMAHQVPAAFNLRWMAPQQFMGPIDVRTVYMRVLLNVGGGGSAALYLWPAGAPGHLVTPFGTIERGTHPTPLLAAGRNDSCLITHVRVADAPGGPPAVTWPAVFGNAPGPVAIPAMPIPALPFPLPAAGALPGIGAAAVMGGLPAGPIGLGNPVNGGALPVFNNAERYVTLTGDNGFNHIASLANGIADANMPRVVGTMAPHHGAYTWLPAPLPVGLAATLAAMPAHGVMGAAPVLGGVALPGAAAMFTAAIPPPVGVVRPTQGAIGAAPAVDPRIGLAAIPAGCIVGGGRIAYSYGARAATGVHPYDHPTDRSVLAHLAHGWSSRMNTFALDWNPPMAAPKRYYAGHAGGAFPGAAPIPHRAGNVALGWQDDGTGAGAFTYLWRDILPGGPAAAGAAINRACPVCGQAHTFEY